MYQNETTVRVRYAETDQMGVVYYGVYSQYFEVGRVEAMRELGINYREMEEKGTMLPVVNLEVNFHRSATYDRVLTVRTSIQEMPGVKITFHHEVFDENDQLLTTGKVVLVFVDAKSMRPKRRPDYVVEKLAAYF